MKWVPYLTNRRALVLFALVLATAGVWLVAAVSAL